MNLFTILDNTHRRNSLQLQQNYSIWKDGEIQAAGLLIRLQRSWFKYVAFFYLIFTYIAVNLGLVKGPKAPHFPAYPNKTKKPATTEAVVAENEVAATSAEVLPNSGV